MDKPESSPRRKTASSKRKRYSAATGKGSKKPSPSKKVVKKVPTRKKPSPKESSSSRKEAPSSSGSPKVEKTLRTLLNVPGRAKLPDHSERQSGNRQGAKSKLVEIVCYFPDRYKTFIELIRRGVSFNVAAESIGVSQSTFYLWCQKGHEDEFGHEEPIDSFYSRLVKDIYAAAAIATGEAEEEVRRLDPKKWLAHGPGRIFGNAWSKDSPERIKAKTTRQSIENDQDAEDDKQTLLTQSPSEIVDGIFTTQKRLPAPSSSSENSKPGSEEKGDGKREAKGSETGKLSLSTEDEYQALLVLEGIRCLTLSPEMRAAYEQQITGKAVEIAPQPDAIEAELLDESEVE